MTTAQAPGRTTEQSVLDFDVKSAQSALVDLSDVADYIGSEWSNHHQLLIVADELARIYVQLNDALSSISMLRHTAAAPQQRRNLPTVGRPDDAIAELLDQLNKFSI
jgi:hypothetical protein